MQLQCFCLNIEHNRHLTEVVGYIKERIEPDVVILQEVLLSDVSKFKDKLNMDGHFVPLAQGNNNAEFGIKLGDQWGLLTLTRLPIIKFGIEYYVGNKNNIPSITSDPNSVNRAVLWTKTKKQNCEYLILNTHFTWSFGGQSTDLQRGDLKKLFKVLNQKKFADGLILAGDMNAPRPKPGYLGEIWSQLSKRYVDNIPKNTSTTIDPIHHKHKGLSLVVDGCFSSGDHHVSGAKIVSGLSDHCGILFNVDKL